MGLHAMLSREDMIAGDHYSYPLAIQGYQIKLLLY